MNKSEQSTTLKQFQELYVKAEYAAARKLILEHKSSFEPGIFSYNLGTLYIKDGQYAIGRYHFEKAIEYGFVNTQTFANLSATKSHLAVNTQKNFFDNSLNVGLSIPTAGYFSISLILILISLILLKTEIIRRGYVFLVFLLLSVLPIAMGGILKINYDFAISFKQITVREGPSEIFQESSKVPAGEKLVVQKPKDGWFYIVSPMDYAGWVKRKHLGVL